MRLLYTASGADFCPVLAIAEFTPADVRTLRGMVAALAQGQSDAADLDALAPCDIRLELRVASDDQGICDTHPVFVCKLTRQSWMDVYDMLEPFLVEEPHCYQWLADFGDVSLLISRGGMW